MEYVHDTLRDSDGDDDGLNDKATTIGAAQSPAITMASIRSDHFFLSDRQKVQQFPCCMTQAFGGAFTPETSSQFLNEYTIRVEVFEKDADEDRLARKLGIWAQGVQELLNDLTATNMWNNTIQHMIEGNIDYDPQAFVRTGNVYVRHVVLDYTVLSDYGNFIT
tara:strand:+ start:1414 stop:1905 length:492 start_codon:yes stop_codon:yes gene_type:complete